MVRIVLYRSGVCRLPQREKSFSQAAGQGNASY